MSQLITLESDKGEQLLKDILSETDNDKKYVQPLLISSHYKQKTNATCGIASSLMLFNARLRYLNINPFTEYQLLIHKNFVKATNNKISNIFKSGLTLSQVSNILNVFKCNNMVNVCKNKNDTNEINKFREFCKQIFQDNQGKKGMIVNYYMKDIGQSYKFGHHSPIAAYHNKTDRVLILDCFKPAKPLWVKITSLYNAMATFDNGGNQYRGYIVVDDVNIDTLLNVNKNSKL